MSYAIEVNEVSKIIGDTTLLQGINMRVRRGEIYGLSGANGAGKTSLMKVMYRIMKPTSGSIRLLDEDITEGNNTVFSRIGSIIETPIFYSSLNAYENLALHCGYMGIGTESIEEVLELFGLSDTGSKAVKYFSLGMKQRLALARALLTKPELLILDEPINGLDPQGISEIRELLLQINREYNTTILISSHILDELSRIADTIGVINCGEMLEEIPMQEIHNKSMDLESYYSGLMKGVTA